jgi:alpha-ribazole phosphatase
MKTIYLLRHGEIQTCHPRRFVGRRELPLTPSGRQQMADLAELFARRSIDKLISSPLGRCRESATILAEQLEVEYEVRHQLTEINLGAWEGMTVAEVEERYPGQHAARGRDIVTFRPDGGESFQDLLDRSWPVFDELWATAGEGLAVIAHAGVNRVLLCTILGIPLANLFRIDQAYGCVNIIHRGSKGLTVHCLNCRPDLSR